MINNFLTHVFNFLLALGWTVLLTAVVNGAFGLRIELAQAAAFMALAIATRHNPPPFKD